MLFCESLNNRTEREPLVGLQVESRPGARAAMALRVLLPVALVAAIGQVALGGVVRVTESGLGCPDWPLCHGRIIPPWELATVIEYTHRLSASLLGVLVLVAAVLAWAGYRSERRVVASVSLALLLVAAAAVLGGLAVLTELDRWVVLVHLGVAEGVVACLVVASVVGWGLAPTSPERTASWDASTSFRLLVAGSLVGLFALVLVGSYMVGLGYGSSCSTWPLCRGVVWPVGDPYVVHMTHRLLAIVVGGLIVATAALAWRARRERRDLAWASGAAAGLYIGQVLVGALLVWTSFSVALKSLHLGLATVAWASVVYLAALAFLREPGGLLGATATSRLEPGVRGLSG